MLTRQDVVTAIEGLKRLARFDVSGFTRFDASFHGMGNAYRVVAVLTPLFVLQSILANLAVPASSSPLWYAVGTDFFTYVIGWVVFPLSMIRVTYWLGRGDFYYRYMVPYLWFQAVLNLLVLPQSFLLAVLGSTSAPLAGLWLATFVLSIGYSFFLALKGLEVRAVDAAGIVLLDLLLSLVTSGLVNLLGSDPHL